MGWRGEKISVDGMELECAVAGKGAPVLLLQGVDDGMEWLPFHQALAKNLRLHLPDLPGFGRTPLPPWMEDVDDLSYFVLDAMAALGRPKMDLIGIGFGGWVAAEAAARCEKSLRRLVLVDALGIKTGGASAREIADTFVLTHEELSRLAWHDPAAAKDLNVPGAPGLGEEKLLEAIRRRQTIHMLGWRPFMHNPKLLRRLGRIRAPALVLWGESDRVVPPGYGKAYHQAIPGSRYRLVPRAGHYPHREQPEETARAITEFLLED